MNLRFFPKLFRMCLLVSITSLFLPSGWVLSRQMEASEIGTMNVLANALRQMDDRLASRGHNGSNGRNGSDGEDRTIFTNGSQVRIDLAGDDGGDGGDGGDGHNNASCRLPDRPNENIEAPDGGDGGNGGDGGDGGNGGDLTVYYGDRADLRKIYATSHGGRGGRSGRGGRGGNGCECDRRSWERNDTYYYCVDGGDGSQGSAGSQGRNGQAGTLWLVNRTEALPPEEPTRQVSIADAADGSALENNTNLSKHIWEERTGANSVLAAGSTMADRYYEFTRRVEGTFAWDWQSDRPPSDFNDAEVTLEIQTDGSILPSFPEEVWVDGTAQYQENLTTFTVIDAIKASEATQLQVADFASIDSSLQLAVVDLAQKSDRISTEFWLKYRSADGGDRPGRRNRYRTDYEGVVPAAFITQDYNRFIIDLNELSIEENRRNVEIELVVRRSFAGNSTEQEIFWTGTIPRR